ncbi:beta-ketoacyl-ACP synthase III [Amycolatopsis sp. CA-230715]|uniref:beta-ketoacyl-ACP synthase III n=1 Tax=Amycolatopsis sp. CA-230715 TaxID=2745196 RepID=UPI001C01D2B9|nr:beta-ketoacyl-ACP synthase III [Amycolatopsis sp. CA-230715]QWF84509.1 3-oxoacyl-[acyl-carrier-protein] synthase 3 [Amycolatopsis sp. CA-230715]
MQTEQAREVPVVAGLGSWLPPRVVRNEELAQRLDTSDEWIRTRTGIAERRIAGDGIATIRMAIEAGSRALRSASAQTVDALVLATSTPDQLCPASAPQVATGLGFNGIPAFDVNAVCSGFLYGLASGGGLISSGMAQRVLVIGADTFSTLINPDDRTTMPIFGDGAGAVVLRAGRPDELGALGPIDLHSDGDQAGLLFVPAGGAQQRVDGVPMEAGDYFLAMKGAETFYLAYSRMAESARTVLDRAGWTVADVDRFVGHQANARILYTVAKQLGVPEEKVAVNVDRVGNTVAASIPLALADSARDGTLRTGDRVLLSAFGAGLTWGAAVLRWPDLRVC